MSAYDDFLGKKVQIRTGFFAGSIGRLEEPKGFIQPNTTFRERMLYRVALEHDQGGVVLGLQDMKFLNDQS